LPEYLPTKLSLNSGSDGLTIRHMARNPSEMRWQIYAYIEHMLNGWVLINYLCMLFIFLKDGITAMDITDMNACFKLFVKPIQLNFQRTLMYFMSYST